jgi:hypothetical protein
MAESSDTRRLGTRRANGTTPPSTAQVMAAIRETRGRLETQLARTAHHVHTLFTTPSSEHVETRDKGVIAGAVKAIAVAGRTKRAWNDARRTGALRRASIGAAALAIAAVLIARRRHHTSQY